MDRLVAFPSPAAQVPWVMARGLPPENPESNGAVGKRLRALRNALKLTQDQMAASLGSASGSALWSQYETGKNRIDIDYALALCRRYGVSLDWIYRGHWHSGLPFDLAERVRFEELRVEERRARMRP